MATTQIDVPFDPREGETRFEVVMQADENGVLWNKRYNKDAWGRPKSIHDYSIFSATWTFGIPSRLWEEFTYDITDPDNPVTTTQIGFTNSSSREGMLSVKGTNTALIGSSIRSKPYPRYQPNRGQIYSTAITCPSPNLSGYRAWGLFDRDNGIGFQLIGDGSSWKLYASRLRDAVITEQTDITATLPDGFDPSKGHVYDVQYEWRGVGNFYFYVDLELVHTMSILGTLDFLSVTDPALPVTYLTVPFTNNSEMEILVGCVDVSSEGGTKQKTLFGSIDTEDTLVTLGASTEDTAILAMHVPRLITYNSNTVLYSRGAIMDKLVTWTRDEALTKVYLFRDSSSNNLSNLTEGVSDSTVGWKNIEDSEMFYSVGGTGTLLDNAFQADFTANVASKVVQEWADIDEKNKITNDSKNSDFVITPGDILVVTVRSIGAANVKSSGVLHYSEKL